MSAYLLLFNPAFISTPYPLENTNHTSPRTSPSHHTLPTTPKYSRDDRKINPALTRGNCIDQCADHLAVVPVRREVVDGTIRNLALDPSQQPLFWGRLRLFGSFVLPLPHGHGDGVVQNEGPYQTQDQLQLVVHNVRAVCKQKDDKLQETSQASCLFFVYFIVSVVINKHNV